MMKLLGRAMVWLRHLACGLTGAIAFGGVAYLLDIGGIKTAGPAGVGFDNPVLVAAALLIVVFSGLDIVMQRLMGGPGSL